MSHMIILKLVFCIKLNHKEQFTDTIWRQPGDVFTPALFSCAESNSGLFSPLVQFVWVGVNTVIEQPGRKKQPDSDRVQLQINSGVVHLWYEHAPASIHRSFGKNCTFLDLTSSYSQLHCALWSEDHFVNKQRAVRRDTYVNRGLTRRRNKIHFLLDIWADDHTAQQLKKRIKIMKWSKSLANN